MPRYRSENADAVKMRSDKFLTEPPVHSASAAAKYLNKVEFLSSWDQITCCQWGGNDTLCRWKGPLCHLKTAKDVLYFGLYEQRLKQNSPHKHFFHIYLHVLLVLVRNREKRNLWTLTRSKFNAMQWRFCTHRRVSSLSPVTLHMHIWRGCQ